ncbi:hypothetical protein ACOMHN_057062 [Nucella lapillus]
MFTVTSPPLTHNSANQDKGGANLDPVSQETVALVTDVLSCHVNPIIGACGIVGNLLNILVFLTQKRNQPINSLLLVLAVVDACFLVFVNLYFVTCYIRSYDVIAARNFSILTLPHVMWIGITLSRISSMLTVVISVERCLVVMMPLKAKVLVTPFTIHVTTMLACVIPALAHIPVFLRGEVQWLLHTQLNISLPYLKLTEFALNNTHFMNLYKNLALNVLFRYVTMGVSFVCTVLTIAQLKRYSRWRLSSITSEAERATISERDARVSVIMSCVMLTMRLIEPRFDFYGVYKRSFDVAREVTDLSLVINSSANFIIYFRGSDDFRRTFCKIFRKCLPGCCFRFLFRCVMRSDEDPSKLESQNSEYFDGISKKKKKQRMAVSTFASTTNVSNVFSVTSTAN